MMRRLSGAFLAALIVALAAAPLFSKPPDLPQDPKIIVGPQIAPDGSTFIPAPGFLEGEGLLPSCETGGPVDPKTITESLHEMWITSLFLDVDPFLAVWTADAAPVSEPAKPEASQSQSVCPYVRQQSAAKPVRVIANPEAFRSVMDNLRALEQAGELIKTARQLAGEGNWEEAKECLEKARVLCPGSSCEKQIEQVYSEILSAADAQMETKPESAEEQEPEGCGCCGGCMFQFGMCWMSQLADWCKEQEANSTKPDESDADSQASGSACPKCEILHAKYVKEHGIEEQVNGLMKACYLAIGDERFEKAVDLARQAYALDPARVESDPIVYKMHLLAKQVDKKPTAPASPVFAPAPSFYAPAPPFPLDSELKAQEEVAKKCVEEQAAKHHFMLGIDPEFYGVSLTDMGRLLQGSLLTTLPVDGVSIRLGTSGIGVRGAVPYNGVCWTLFYDDGLFWIWMAPETKAE